MKYDWEIQAKEKALKKHNEEQMKEAARLRRMFGRVIVYKDDYTGELLAYRDAQPEIEARDGYSLYYSR